MGTLEMATGRGHLHQVTQSHPWSAYLPTPEFPSGAPTPHLAIFPRLFSISIEELFQESEVVYEHILILLKKKKKHKKNHFKSEAQRTHTPTTLTSFGTALSLQYSLNTFQASQKCGLYVVSISAHLA